MHNGDAQHGPRDEAKRELELRLRQQAVLAELGRRALSHAPFEHLLEEAARLAAVGLTATYAKVLEYLADQNRLLVRAGIGWEPGVVGQATIGADLDSPAGYALHTGKPVISNLLSNESRFRTPQLLAEHGVRRAINVILLSEGRPYGVLEVDSEQPGAFSENDVDFLQGIANLLGVAIERWRSDEELRRLNQELESRVAAALAERRQAEDALRQAQKMEAIGQLTGGVAHDFNNLLLVISGNLELIAQQVANDERLSHLVATAQQGATRGTQLTSQLLAFARRQTLRPETRSVNELIREVDVLSARILSEAVEMNLLLDPAAGSCFVDPAPFASAVLNLVLNARDAMPSGGRLTVTTGHVVIDPVAAAEHPEAQPGDYVVVEVADTGSGMSPAVLERATEPFFTTKEPGKGTGLGLSQVYGFLRQSSGFLAIESAPDAGTTVRMYFPRIADAFLKPTVGPAAKTGGEVVLVVDDDADVRDLVVLQLETLGYSTLVAANAPAALELLAAANTPNVDLLLSDLAMPGGMSGAELVREAKVRHPALKAVLSSGYLMPGSSCAAETEQLMNTEAKLLPKPYSQEELGRVVAEALASDQAG